jgi:hypothetical protein
LLIFFKENYRTRIGTSATRPILGAIMIFAGMGLAILS